MDAHVVLLNWQGCDHLAVEVLGVLLGVISLIRRGDGVRDVRRVQRRELCGHLHGNPVLCHLELRVLAALGVLGRRPDSDLPGEGRATLSAGKWWNGGGCARERNAQLVAEKHRKTHFFARSTQGRVALLLA